MAEIIPIYKDKECKHEAEYFVNDLVSAKVVCPDCGREVPLKDYAMYIR